MSEAIGVGVIGMGFMGRTHVRSYAEAARTGLPNRLVALCDRNLERLTGSTERGTFETGDEGPLFDPQETRVVSDPRELLVLEEVDVVSICTPTDSHVDLAIQALEAGKHVLVEKPVALVASEVERLAAAAANSDRVCMPAMCIRFWPGWSWLRDAVRDRTYGAVTSAVFRRLAPRPAWGREFYEDTARSGGALFDLHVHDADFVRCLFGEPDDVTSTGTEHHVTTLYHYANGPAHVVAEGGWDHADGFPFHMGYTVLFENATASWSIERDPALHIAVNGEDKAVRDVQRGTGYDFEIRHLLAVLRGEEELSATIEEAVGLTRMLERERASLAGR